MDELVFTNPEGPKVTPYQERSGPACWAAFTAKWPSSLVETNASSDREWQPEGAFHVRRPFQKRAPVRLGERKQILKNSLRVLMDRFADQDGSHDGPAVENLTLW